jgi:hypothetical protein
VGAHAALGSLGIDEVRRGVMLAEILGPPVATRKSERLF